MEPTASAPILLPERNHFPMKRQLLFSQNLVLVLAALYFAGVYFFVPDIASPENLTDILMTISPLLIAAIGQTFVLIIAGIDLSASAILALASVVGASFLTGDNHFTAPLALLIPVGVVLFLLVGLAIGWFNGIAVTRLGMPAFMVTLTVMMFLNGFSVYYTSVMVADGGTSTSFGNLPDAFIAIGSGNIFGVPYCVIIAALVALVAHLILSRTVFGARLYAIGRNPKAAEISGVPVIRYTICAFVISGFCAAISSIIYTGQLETGSPVLGQRILLDVVGAAVIGGVSLFGGKGRISWAFNGVLFLVVVDKGLQLLGFAVASVFAIKGLLILLAAVVDAFRRRFELRG